MLALLECRPFAAGPHGADALSTTGAGIQAAARFPQRCQHPALGLRRDDAPRQLRPPRRAARRAGDGESRFADFAARLPLARPRGSEQRRPGGLAERQPARDAPRARARHRYPAQPGVAARQGDRSRRGQMDGGQAEERLRHLRAASRGGREPAARQGQPARQGAQSRSVRRLARRVQPGHDQRRDRHDLHYARPPSAGPDPGSDRAAGAAPAAGNRRPLRALQATRSSRSKS